MRNAIILHGLPDKDEYYGDQYPSASNSHWLPWLQKQLLMRDIKADTPEIYQAYQPNYDSYVREVERYDITPQTILVGHSMGAGFWVQYLTQNPTIRVDTLVLVAPWMNAEKSDDIDFFDGSIDQDLIKRVSRFIIFTSDNDDLEIQSCVEELTRLFPDARVRKFHDYGHFTYGDMKTDAFPELLDEIVSPNV